jgi:hypothetical protein
MRTLLICVARAMMLTVLITSRLFAQPLRVTSVAPLDFQTLSPSLTRVVTPPSAQAAVFTVQGPASSIIEVLVATPEQLVGTSQYVRVTTWTATVTTQFGTSPSAIPLIPGNELSVTLGTDGLATIRVGATILPPMSVGSGVFTGALTVVARQASGGLMSLTAQSAITATIRQPLILTATPMSFGNVFVSTPKVVAPTDLNAFHLLVDGALNASVEVTVESAPSSLIRVGGSTPLTIGSWLTRNGGASCTSAPVTATVGVSVALDLLSPVGGSGRTSYCLGATVSPTALQEPGEYLGAVVVSVRYTGA